MYTQTCMHACTYTQSECYVQLSCFHGGNPANIVCRLHDCCEYTFWPNLSLFCAPTYINKLQDLKEVGILCCKPILQHNLNINIWAVHKYLLHYTYDIYFIIALATYIIIFVFTAYSTNKCIHSSA